MLQDDLITSSTMNTYNIGMMKGFEFAVPRKKQKMVDTFHKALLSNSRLAYISFTKKAGSASIETNRVGYGNNNSMTYVYALVWYPGKDDMVLGSVYKFYSKDPQAYKKSLVYKMNAVQGLDSLVSLGNIRYNKNLVRSYGLDMTPPKDAAEFMVQLNTLRAAFKNARDQYPYFGNQVTRRTLQTGVANKIVKLCKGYGKLLNADEKKFCATSLNKMKKDTDDDYLQSLLELTANSLRK